MQAVVFDEYGPPKVLRIGELPTPRPRAGQVRVRVWAGGIQPFDTAVRRGSMEVPVVFPQQLGNEFSAVVDQRSATGSRIGWTATRCSAGDSCVRSRSGW